MVTLSLDKGQRFAVDLGVVDAHPVLALELAGACGAVDTLVALVGFGSHELLVFALVRSRKKEPLRSRSNSVFVSDLHFPLFKVDVLEFESLHSNRAHFVVG